METSRWPVGKEEVEKAVRDKLLARARDEENGSARCLRAEQPWDAVLMQANACFLRIGGREVVAAFDGEVVWQVKRRYSSRKRCGCYPQLKPKLVELDLDRNALEAGLRESGCSERIVGRVLGRTLGRRA